jgi:Na+/H+ antiporter NhaA
MTDPPGGAAPLSGRTAWARGLETPLRAFLQTETGSAAILLAATIAALIWANVDTSSYQTLWGTQLSVRAGGHGISQDLRHWLNAGLMTFFFFVVGLEARREFDVGELRERWRVAVPLVAAVGGMVVPIGIYLAINAGRPSEHGWAAAMSTDTAFALGMLALVAPRAPQRLRAFLLTIAVVDDLVAIAIIAVVYSDHVDARALVAALGILAAILLVRAARVRQGLVYTVLGAAAWVALFESGVDPVVVAVAMGLLGSAHPAARGDLERATDLFRLFREQPTPELARSARIGVASAISPNDRLQLLYHPWTSYVIVPLFALANAGITISGAFLSRAFTSPITLGILLGYVFGKPVGITSASWIVTRLSRGRLRPPVGWATVVGGGAIAGIGFTVSLLVATLARGAARRGEDGCPRRRPLRLGDGMGRVPRHSTPPRMASDASADGCGGPHPRPRRTGRSPPRPCPRSPGRPGDVGRVRRLRMPVLRPRGAGRPRAARRAR